MSFHQTYIPNSSPEFRDVVPVATQGRRDGRLLVPEGNDGRDECDSCRDSVDPQLKEKEKIYLNRTLEQRYPGSTCALYMYVGVCNIDRYGVHVGLAMRLRE